jgi:hypothetical protein
MESINETGRHMVSKSMVAAPLWADDYHMASEWYYANPFPYCCHSSLSGIFQKDCGQAAMTAIDTPFRGPFIMYAL